MFPKFQVRNRKEAMKNRPQEAVAGNHDGLNCHKTVVSVRSLHARVQTILHFEPVVWRIAHPCSGFRKRTELSRGNER